MNFIINRWVRGDDFFGREQLLAQIAERRRKPTWVLGNRRVGKTSLLRQIQYLCKAGEWDNRVALYWDLQGAGSADGLKEAFLECLEDHEEITEALGLDVDDLEELPFKDVLNKFRRKAKGLKETHLLLLIDECEELVDITAREPGILAPFRKLSQGDFPFSIIMAGSWRMMDLDESDVITSPFLPDFLPPLLLGPFDEVTSVSLLQQRGLDADVAATIHRLCLGNPHLLQVLGEHMHRVGNLELALAELRANKVAHYFFQSNFNCLPPSPRPWFAEGTACRNLASLSPKDTNLPFLVQSALLNEALGGCRVSPLLHMLEENLEPPAVIHLAQNPGETPVTQTAPRLEQPQNGELKATSPAPSSSSDDILVVIEKLAACKVMPLALPVGSFGDENWSFEFDLPSIDNLLQQGTAGANLHQLLDRVSPEYLRGELGDERTAVYLAGLWWYRQLSTGAPFSHLDDPYERLAEIAESDVAITGSFREKSGLSGKQAMVLLRCLKANANHRYPSLAHMANDLKS